MSSSTLLRADCRTALQPHAPFDLLIADPPYGGTALTWDRRCAGWIQSAASLLKPNGSLWVFGSMRLFVETGTEFRATGLRYAQDIVWEKQNGSGFAADRFRRVHECVVQFYSAAARWADIYNEVQHTPRTGPDKTGACRASIAHTGGIRSVAYVDTGTRIMRSVIRINNMHGRAIHPTEKPADLMEILIRTSCPVGGLVGDMFAGSCAAGVAAERCGRNYVGCEIDDAMATKAEPRLAA